MAVIFDWIIKFDIRKIHSLLILSIQVFVCIEMASKQICSLCHPLTNWYTECGFGWSVCASAMQVTQELFWSNNTFFGYRSI